MSFDRDRLLEALPLVYRRDPMAVATLRLAYRGTGRLTMDIDDGTLVVHGMDGAVGTTVDLEGGVTYAALVAALNALPGYLATLADPGAGAVQAITLLEEEGVPVEPAGSEFADIDFAPDEFAVIAPGTSFARWTSPLWQILEPFRHALKAQVVTLERAIAQLFLLQAAGFFADYWGLHTVTPRHPAEADDPYVARQRRELVRPRENNFALADLIEEDTGVPVLEVRDLYPDVFRANRGRVNRDRLMGRYYNAASCEVRLGGFPTAAAVTAAKQNVAGGITVFVLGQEPLDAGDTTTLHFDDTPISITPPPPMQIGVTPIGIGKIGP